MKNLKVKLAAIALILGMGSALATTHHAFLTKTWGKESGGRYIDLTGQLKGTDFFCNGAINTCTEDYPADVDPNNQATDAHPGIVSPTNIVPGNFSN